MKREYIRVLIIVLVLLIAAVVCMGIFGVMSGPPPSRTWSGTWLTSWNQGEAIASMTLVQSGNAVTGTYESNDGKITGSVQGSRLTGTWSEGDGASGGPFELELSSDGRMFAGWWAGEGTDPNEVRTGNPDWLGTRIS